MQPNKLFIQIYKAKSHVSASLLIKIPISILPGLFTCSHSQLHMWRHEHNNASYSPSVPLRSEYGAQPHLSFSDHWWRLRLESPWNHRLQPLFFARMVTKPGAASTEPSNAFWAAEAAKLRVHKYLHITGVSQKGPCGRVFSIKKRNWQNRAQSSLFVKCI